MKKLFSFLLAILLLSSGVPVGAKGTKDWKSAYSAYLTNTVMKTKNAAGNTPVGFSVWDLDGNGVPELIVSDGNYAAAVTHIYGYEGGKVIEIGTFGTVGYFLFDPVNLRLRSVDFHDNGCMSDVRYKLKDNRLIKTYYTDEVVENGKEKYIVNGKEVPSNEYALRNYKSKDVFWLGLGSTFDLDSDVVKAVFGSYNSYKTAYSRLTKAVKDAEEPVMRDINGDGTPELFYRTDKRYYIFTYRGGTLYHYDDINYEKDVRHEIIYSEDAGTLTCCCYDRYVTGYDTRRTGEKSFLDRMIFNHTSYDSTENYDIGGFEFSKGTYEKYLKKRIGKQYYVIYSNK